MISIRRRLLLFLFLILTAGILGFAFITFINTREELTDLLDENMQQVAIAIALQGSDYQRSEPPQKQILSEQGDFLIQVWDESGVLQYTSHPDVAISQQKGNGFGFTFWNRQDWRYYLHSVDNKKIQIVQSMNERREDILEFTYTLLIPIATQLPLMLILSYFMIGAGLKPLSSMSGSIARRDTHNLSPIDIGKVPLEIQTVVLSLNQLLARLEQAISQQRQFTADAAHELRTPLAVVKLQLDVLERASDETERKTVHKKLMCSIDRCAHLVHNLLLLARQEEHEAAGLKMFRVSLPAIANEVFEEYLPLAKENGIQLQFIKGGQNIIVLGEPHGLRLMIGNIVQNAIFYTPQGGTVDISIKADGRETLLSVVDNGIGIPEKDRTRIFDRFYRVLRAQSSGSGLGLAIVKHIADQQNIKIAVQDGQDGRGTEFRIIFPEPQPD